MNHSNSKSSFPPVSVVCEAVLKSLPLFDWMNVYPKTPQSLPVMRSVACVGELLLLVQLTQKSVGLF